jgi:hypothetical protein
MAIINGQIWAGLIALSFFCFYYPAAIEYEDRKLKALFPETKTNPGFKRIVHGRYCNKNNQTGLETTLGSSDGGTGKSIF